MSGKKREVSHRSAGVILVDRQGRILLQLRDEGPDVMFPGHWGITGGASLEGETPRQTARREVREETGLRLRGMTLFKVCRRSGPEPGMGYETHYFHAPTDCPAEEMTVGEGRELRFFSPGELDGLALAYSHAEVLRDFVASPHYQAYLDGAAPVGGDEEALDHLGRAVAGGSDWFVALLEAMALWRQPEETVNGRRYRYLLDSEAFDWLLLAERLCEAVGQGVPGEEVEALLFFGRPPAALEELEFRRLIGPAKHRAHLNYLYGVTVEEALQLAVEEEVHKERRSPTWGDGRSAEDVAFERLYGRPLAEMLASFREERSLPSGDSLAYGELKEFTYWLFKYRVRRCDPARVASDTRKALAQLSELEAASRRRWQRSARGSDGAGPVVVDVDVEGGRR